MAYISRTLRQLVTERAGGLCEYCHTAQAIVIEMEIDHIVPEVAGGATEAGNLCLACISCNTFKRDHQTGIDAQTDAEVPLFHPRQQQWHEHFQWDEGNTHHRHDSNWPSNRDALTDEPQYRHPGTAAMGTSWLASP